MFVMFMKPVNIQSLSTMLAGDLSRGSKKIKAKAGTDLLPKPTSSWNKINNCADAKPALPPVEATPLDTQDEATKPTQDDDKMGAETKRTPEEAKRAPEAKDLFSEKKQLKTENGKQAPGLLVIQCWMGVAKATAAIEPLP